MMTALSLLIGAPALANDAPSSSSSSSSSPSSSSPDDPATHGDACIDEHIKADLFAKRKLRGTRDRLFQQTNRHEILLQGGYYVSDLFDGTAIGGVGYAYHMTEDFAVEATASYTQLQSSGGPELERTFAVLGNKKRHELVFDADLVWTPAHGKMRVGGAIQHFDLYLAGGGGLVDSALSSDVAGNGGFGLKFFFGRMFALRIDVRDHIYKQQLLTGKVIVNDLTTVLGFSLYLPFGE